MTTMARYRATFRTAIEVRVEIDVPDSVHPADQETRVIDEGWDIAEEYLQALGTQTRNPAITAVETSLDGIGAALIEELS